MGVLPLQFQSGANAASLKLTGRELFEIIGIRDGLKSMGQLTVRAVGDQTVEFQALVRIDTPEELVAFRHGGILPYVLRQLVARN
jgi:aconitate hydratase